MQTGNCKVRTTASLARCYLLAGSVTTRSGSNNSVTSHYESYMIEETSHEDTVATDARTIQATRSYRRSVPTRRDYDTTRMQRLMVTLLSRHTRQQQVAKGENPTSCTCSIEGTPQDIQDQTSWLMPMRKTAELNLSSMTWHNSQAKSAELPAHSLVCADTLAEIRISSAESALQCQMVVSVVMSHYMCCTASTTLTLQLGCRTVFIQVNGGARALLLWAPAGNFTRVVRLVVLRLFNMKGMLCVKLAEQSGSTFHTRISHPYYNIVAQMCFHRFQLPGRKIEGDDTHEETMKKWLDGELRPLARAIRLEEETETVMGFDQSQSFDLPTKYIKTIQKAFLVGNIEFHEDALDKNISELSHSNTLSSVPSSIKTLLSNVLSTSGDNPTFALLREETGPTESANMMKWSLSPANMRGGDSKGNSQDAHQVLGPRLSALTSKSKLQKLHKWH
eukprot:6459800-Amphidinium_carterae.1